MSRLIKVVAVDGGGVRGIIPALVLAAIEEQTGKRIAQLFDVIAGTSTGGIIALGLTRPAEDGSGLPHYEAKDLANFYTESGKTIFHQTWMREIATADGGLHAKYDTKPIEKLLREVYFGDARLADTVTDVVVASYDITGDAPFFFKTSYAKQKEEWNYPMWQAARATSAAPTYFEPQPLPDDARLGTGYDHACVDGGVFANNPAMCAYAEALRTYPHEDDYLVVSLGTGKHRKSIRFDEARHWGLVGWARPILTVVLAGVEEAVEYQLTELCRDSPDGEPRYYRIQSDLKYASEHMDDASQRNLDNLRRDAEELVAAQGETISKICALLTAGLEAEPEPAAAAGTPTP